MSRSPEASFSIVKEMLAGLEGQESEIIEVLLGVKSYIDRSYKRPANVYSRVRHLFKNSPLLPLVRRVLKLTLAEFKAECKKQKDAVEAKNSRVVKFKPDYVAGVIGECKRGGSIAERGVALQLAVGCRQKDLFDDEVVFEAVAGEDSKVLQIGSSKKKGPFVLEKQLICMTADEFRELLREFREELPPRAYENSSFNRHMGEVTKEFFPTQHERSGTHLNRAIYAACRRLLNESNSPARAIQLALGHEDMATAPHYMYVNVGE